MEAVLPLFTIYMVRKNAPIQNDEDDDNHDQEQKDLASLIVFGKLLSARML